MQELERLDQECEKYSHRGISVWLEHFGVLYYLRDRMSEINFADNCTMSKEAVKKPLRYDFRRCVYEWGGIIAALLSVAFLGSWIVMLAFPQAKSRLTWHPMFGAAEGGFIKLSNNDAESITCWDKYAPSPLDMNRPTVQRYGLAGIYYRVNRYPDNSVEWLLEISFVILFVLSLALAFVCLRNLRAWNRHR